MEKKELNEELEKKVFRGRIKVPYKHTAGAYVYLKNAGELNLFVKFEATASGAVYDMFLDAGAWALFPWAADTSDIRVYASGSTGCLLEYGVFE